MCQTGSGHPITRREAVAAMAASATLAHDAVTSRGVRAGQNTARPYLGMAQRAERWLRANVIRSAEGVTWAADPLDPASVQHNLYSGSPGVVLFYLELAQATRDADALAMARDGARFLAARVTAPDAAAAFGGENAGLYTGLAGIVYVLDRAHAATGVAALGAAARRAATLLAAGAKPAGGGAAWSESNDIISGSAGIGLTLLWAAGRLGMPELVSTASKAGLRLLETGTRVGVGRTWPISPSVPRRYPNFSHGAGGVSYFLTRLYETTHTRPFLDGALEGAAYLHAVATETPGGGRMIFHSEPGNEQLFYLSWCHGPSGTARLFHALARATGNRDHATWADKLNTATRDMKVPERSPGFWNNISQCCGNCGVVEHFVAMYDRSGDTRTLDYARVVADDVLARATPDGEGAKWVQAEHRVRPELLVAQTGLMQGAAGVGLALLHLDGAFERRRPFIVLPDSPYYS